MEPEPLTIAQQLRLRIEPRLEAPVRIVVPAGSLVEVLSVQPHGWAQIRTQDETSAGWCRRQMLNAARRMSLPVFQSGEDRMWALIRQYTGRTAYERGVKGAGLGRATPVIDCSGWVALLLTEAMTAQNASAGEDIFDPADIAVCHAWSDRIILEIEARTPLLLEGAEITAASLPRNATIGLNEGYLSWQENYPRLRGINHIVQVLRRPTDGAPYVSESHPGGSGGVRLTPLADWLTANASQIQDGRAWAVDPLAMARPSRTG
jgi:hypothetical protein